MTFPLTFAVEGALALVYASVRRRPWVVFASLVVMANLFTYPAFLFSWFMAGDGTHIWIIMGLEGLVWLVEAVVLFLPMRRMVSFVEALGVSCLFNLASFGIGLLLPLGSSLFQTL